MIEEPIHEQLQCRCSCSCRVLVQAHAHALAGSVVWNRDRITTELLFSKQYVNNKQIIIDWWLTRKCALSLRLWVLQALLQHLPPSPNAIQVAFTMTCMKFGGSFVEPARMSGSRQPPEANGKKVASFFFGCRREAGWC